MFPDELRRPTESQFDRGESTFAKRLLQTTIHLAGIDDLGNRPEIDHHPKLDFHPKVDYLLAEKHAKSQEISLGN